VLAHNMIASHEGQIVLIPKAQATLLPFMFAALATAQTADMILIHGKILTVDTRDSVAEAVAIAKGKIVAVGSTAEIQPRAGPGTRVIDLHGLTATPGLIDTHGHFAVGGVDEVFHVVLGDAQRVSDAVHKIRQKAATLKPGEWLVGAGWDEGKLAERRYLLASDLDTVTPNNPVWLMQLGGHYGVANSYALRLARITASTPDPTAGTIDRDPQGHPTGVLKEAAKDLVTNLIAPTTAEQWQLGILHSIDGLHREGMTAVKEADTTKPIWDAYRELLRQNKLDEHIFVLWHAGNSLESARATLAQISTLPTPPASLGDGVLLSGGAKIFMDGSGGARTAWMHDDWNKNSTDVDTGNSGYPAVDPEVYRQQVRLFHQAGIHVGTHAIGDRAIDWVVGTYAEVLREKPARGLRHSIIHCFIPTDHAIDLMASLQKQYDAAYPETQPPFMWWFGDTYAGNFGLQRSPRFEPFRTWFAKGVRWAGGSDYFVNPYPARYGIWAALERETLKGLYGAHPFGVSEVIDVRTVLRSYTAWAARQLFLEDRIGTIEPGKDADIAVWDRDLYTVSTRDIKDLKCSLTIFGGRIVYRDSTARIVIR
jgi:predicted amidohydrolase YtcJ